MILIEPRFPNRVPIICCTHKSVPLRRTPPITLGAALGILHTLAGDPCPYILLQLDARPPRYGRAGSLRPISGASCWLPGPGPVCGKSAAATGWRTKRPLHSDRRKDHYCGMQVVEARRLKALENENQQLKTPAADRRRRRTRLPSDRASSTRSRFVRTDGIPTTCVSWRSRCSAAKPQDISRTKGKVEHLVLDLFAGAGVFEFGFGLTRSFQCYLSTYFFAKLYKITRETECDAKHRTHIITCTTATYRTPRPNSMSDRAHTSLWSRPLPLVKRTGSSIVRV